MYQIVPVRLHLEEQFDQVIFFSRIFFIDSTDIPYDKISILKRVQYPHHSPVSIADGLSLVVILLLLVICLFSLLPSCMGERGAGFCA